MKNSRIEDLFNKRFEGRITAEEEAEFYNLIRLEDDDDKIYSLMERKWHEFEPSQIFLYKTSKSKVWAEITKSASLKIIPINSKIFFRWMVAASIVMLFSITLFYVNKPFKPVPNNHFSAVRPGELGATLTLSNGKKIRLTNTVQGKIAAESGVNISRRKDGTIIYEVDQAQEKGDDVNTLSTANSEMFAIRLSDGSMVWLNSASTLTYHSLLDKNGTRTVKLTGEGYFEVAKDQHRPFIVQTATQSVEVLGTHFNINSYKEESSTRTTLMEGSVKVKTTTGSRMLTPGFEIINNGQNLDIREADTEQVIDWKNGDFDLDGIEFREAMRKIARWYDVEIIYQTTLRADVQIGGWISRKKPLTNVLKLISESGQVKFKIEGRKVFVID